MQLVNFHLTISAKVCYGVLIHLLLSGHIAAWVIRSSEDTILSNSV